ncbi:MAG TPA: 2-C-methyl-D-erythritol 4-phosphate cytidylyltransferase [Candidatus Krumholzibacteria bacterium]|nr:2-C-methyl-D-erythritol 4-phosphate cytidylyltransferase [Candidatus Krumholzibacteria bacterium]
MNVTVLIMAGGSGERFGAGQPKQLVPINGQPMLAWTSLSFARCDRVNAIVLVGSADAGPALRAALPSEAAARLAAYVAGGATRQESVRNGLDAVPAGTTHVLIHDAARPCLSDRLRDRMLEALTTHDAVIPAVPATDTLVHARDAQVDAIIDRVDVSGVQTPQAFRLDLIVKAHRAARARGFASSDDGSLVLALGEPVAIVDGERTNIKVTYREDVAIAEAILRNGAAA